MSAVAGGPGPRAYELVIYPQLAAAPGPAPCLVPATPHSTAAEVVLEAAARLGLPPGAAGRLALAEVRETGGEEWRLEPGDTPVQRLRLWPRRAQEAHPPEDGYFFLLREHGPPPAGDGDGDGRDADSDAAAGSPAGPARSLADRGLLPRSPADLDDLCDLPELTEAGLLAALHQRFLQRKIYTYAGSILVALNPFRFLPIYNPKYVARYAGRRLGQLEPHVFALADVAFHALRATRRSQCIVISGESGSGKTQTTNFLIHCLTALSQKGHASGVERTILGAGPVLEAFGNAKTAHNDNSSRFGKFIQVSYLESGVVRGAVVEKYLLEKSRLVSREKDERNYHVFYYLLLGVSEQERREFRLQQPEDYFYLNQHNLKIEDGEELKHDFERLKQAMEMVGFLPPTRKQIFSVLSAILYLGNITYKKRASGREDGLEVGPPEALDALSQLLQVQREVLVEVLTKRKTGTANDKLILPYSLGEAITARDSMAKSLYSALFDWIVLRINHALLNKKDVEESVSCLSIGVLDIFGFEDFERNSFEQFCINYANERLQHYFTQYIFKLEQEEYRSEGLSWHHIEYSDNAGCIHLFSRKPTGLFYLLDEESNFPHATSQTLLAKFKQQHEHNRYFLGTPVREPAFIVQHFAGRVKYQVKDFREKNMDHMRPDIVALLRGSDSAYVRGLLGMEPVAVFRWAVLRAAVRALAVLREAGRLRAERAERAQAGAAPGPCSPAGEPPRETGTPSEKLYRDMHDQMIQSIKGLPWQAGDPRQLLQTLGRLRRPRTLLPKTKGIKQKQTIPKNLLDSRSLKLLGAMTLQERTTKSLLHVHKKKKPPSIGAQFQTSLNKLLETLGRAEPFFIRCIRSNAEKKELSFDEHLVLQQLRYTGMLETVRIRRSGYSAKYTFQEFTEQFQALLPRDTQPCREAIATLLERMGVDPATYQIGRTKVFLKESQRQALQETLHREVVRKIELLQRCFRALLERRRFLNARRAAVTIQACWRSYRVRRALERTRAAVCLQAAWRGYRQRAAYVRGRQGIVRLQSLCRGHLQRRSFRQMLSDRRHAREQEEVAAAAEEPQAPTETRGPPPPVASAEPSEKAASSREKRESRRQRGLEHVQFQKRHLQAGREDGRAGRKEGRSDTRTDTEGGLADREEGHLDTEDTRTDTEGGLADREEGQAHREEGHLDTEDTRTDTEGGLADREEGQAHREDTRTDTEGGLADREEDQAQREDGQASREEGHVDREDRRADREDSPAPEASGNKAANQSPTGDRAISVDPDRDTMPPPADTSAPGALDAVAQAPPESPGPPPERPTSLALHSVDAGPEPPKDGPRPGSPGGPAQIQRHRDGDLQRLATAVEMWRERKLPATGPSTLSQSLDLGQRSRPAHTPPEAHRVSLSTSDVSRLLPSPPLSPPRAHGQAPADTADGEPGPKKPAAQKKKSGDASSGADAGLSPGPQPDAKSTFKRLFLHKSKKHSLEGPEEPEPAATTPQEAAASRKTPEAAMGAPSRLPGEKVGGRGRKPRNLKVGKITVSEKWLEPLARRISNANELKFLDEFLLNKMNDLRSRKTPIESLFIEATEKFRSHLKTMCSVPNGKVHVGYKDLLENYRMVLGSLAAERGQRDPSLELNLFQSLLHEFTRNHARGDFEPPKGKTQKKKRKQERGVQQHNGHVFSSYQVNIPQSCEQCLSYIWLMDKALLCSVCKMTCHKKCLTKIQTPCCYISGRKSEPGAEPGHFGVCVDSLTSDKASVPLVLERLLEHVEMHGLYTEGLYRKSGAANRTRELRQALQADPAAVKLESFPIHAVTGVLKQWLRELPEPLMTFAQYGDFLHAVELPEQQEQLAAIYSVLEHLPEAHHSSLERLIFHLVKVALLEDVNRMSPGALAIIFAPCLLRCPDHSDPLSSMKDVLKSTTCVEMLIKEQLRKYRVKMEDISQLEAAETMAVRRLSLLRQHSPWPLRLGFSSSYEGVLTKSPKARAGGGGAPEDLHTLPEEEGAGGEEEREKELLLERIQSIKEEKEDITSRLPELDPRGSDEENLGSETSASTESLLEERAGRAAEGPPAPTPSPRPAAGPPRCRPASFLTVRVKTPRRTPVMPTANIKLPPGLPSHLPGCGTTGEAPVRRREPPARRTDQIHSVYVAPGAHPPALCVARVPEQDSPPPGARRRYSDPPSYCLPPRPGPAHS